MSVNHTLLMTALLTDAPLPKALTQKIGVACKDILTPQNKHSLPPVSDEVVSPLTCSENRTSTLSPSEIGPSLLPQNDLVQALKVSENESKDFEVEVDRINLRSPIDTTISMCISLIETTQNPSRIRFIVDKWNEAYYHKEKCDDNLAAQILCYPRLSLGLWQRIAKIMPKINPLKVLTYHIRYTIDKKTCLNINDAMAYLLSSQSGQSEILTIHDIYALYQTAISLNHFIVVSRLALHLYKSSYKPEDVDLVWM